MRWTTRLGQILSKSVKLAAENRGVLESVEDLKQTAAQTDQRFCVLCTAVSPMGKAVVAALDR